MKPFLKRCMTYFVFAGVFSLFINTLHLTFPLYMLAVYVRVLDSFSFSTLYVMTAMALCGLVVMGLLEFLRSRLLVRAGIKLDRLLTRQSLKQMLADLCRADSTGYTQALRDIHTLRNYLGGNAVFAFFDVPWIFIYLLVIFLVHPILGLVATAGAVVILVLGLLQGWLTRESSRDAARTNQQGKHWLGISFRAARELQCMGMVEAGANLFSRINRTEQVLQDKAGNISQFLGATGHSFGIFMQVAIFGTGAALVLANQASPGVIIAASIIMGRAFAPINQGIAAWKQTAGAKTAYANLTQLLTGARDRDLAVTAAVKGCLDVQAAGLDIDGRTILKEIDFTVKPGEILGLAGPNGAGKTCLCRMILGMWAPDTGKVLLDGREICRLDNEMIGKFLGYLPQGVELFAGTVADNIARMGPKDDLAVVAAAKKAGAHDVILGFDNGYDTLIDEIGHHSLSGGQRQQVGLARALYGSPKLVVLDEPDANLDEAGDAALKRALKQLKQEGAATIMITHKPTLLSVADKILVLRNGTMAKFGTATEVFGQMTGDHR
ncbi:MAG: type I secretion system permease/ATPase [Desulfotignum sp.]